MPVRIYEISKKLGIENKEVIAKARELGITAAKVPTSSLDKITAEFLEQELSKLLTPRTGDAASRIADALKEVRTTRLDLSRLRLDELPVSLRQLTHLQDLDIAYNNLSTLPEWIGKFRNLRRLNATSNRLTALPESIRWLSSLRELYLHGNDSLGIPLELLGPESSPPPGLSQITIITAPPLPPPIPPPLEALEPEPSPSSVFPPNAVIAAQPNTTTQGASASSTKSPTSAASILDYYFRTRRGKRPLNEAKLILVGRGGVGKTCLIKKLISGTFNKHEKETPGIEIHSWEIKVLNGDQVRLNVWDFGGQEILHATHQFFLTERTLYLLVLSGREGKPGQDAEYWLQLIRSFGGDSAVIVALNKSTQHPFDVNRGYLQEKYPSIVEFVKTDCFDGDGIPLLKDLILRQTEALEHRKVDFPSDWFAIKERLAGMEENFVTWARYQELCCELGEPEPQAQRDLAGFLHILGIALNYRDDPRLRDTHVLNPRWVTEGIYPLLRARQVSERHGVLEATDLGTVLDSNTYPPSKHDFLLRLMERFQLCFRMPGNRERYLVPELLGENQPDIRALLEEPGLGFRYQYEVLPEGLLPRFIVQTHTFSAPNPHWRWRTGVVLEWNGCLAVARADYRERRVEIQVTGPEARRRELLAVVRAAFEEQHRDLKGLVWEERVPVPDEPGVTVSYQDLLKREERGEIEFYPENMDQPVSVQALLNGVESPESRTRRRQTSETGMPARKEFHFHTGAHAHFEGDVMKHSGRDINEQKITSSTFTNSPVAIQQALQNCFSTIQQMENAPLKAKLEELHGQVAQLLDRLAPKQSAEVKEDLEVVVAEAAKPEPRKKRFDISADGLIEAAKSVKELAAPVTAVVTEIGKMLFP